MPVDPGPCAASRAVSEVLRIARETTTELDNRLGGILTSDVGVGETVELAFRRKERQLGELFATISVADSADLHRRLSNPRAGDRIAELFGRLTVERRNRLVAFLASAPRRETYRR